MFRFLCLFPDSGQKVINLKGDKPLSVFCFLALI